jgi:uncharacterized protein (TIGR00369 family)
MIDKKKDYTELLQGFRDIYENQVPFNRILGLKLESLTEKDVCIKFKMKDELVGNYVDGVLHGGVISAALDSVGALTASVGILKGMKSLQIDQIVKGTIDLRVDYLRPGKGKHFLATGSIIRMGKKVVVIRMELHNDRKSLIAIGTGTYSR